MNAALLFAAFALTTICAAQELPMTEVAPEQTNEVLLNPGMGLYYQAGSRFSYQPPADSWSMQIVGIAYYRLDWAELEPERGQYRFEEYFGPIFEF